MGFTSFREYVWLREGLLLPDRPAAPGMARLNPFPATQAQLKRLFPRPRWKTGFTFTRAASVPREP